MGKHFLLLSCAAGALGLGAATAQAATATDTAAASSENSASVTEVVVTAEKREQNLQNVPVAISAFTSTKRDIVGIQSIQDMTNFTPGLGYSTSTDRITLRGVGRTTNVLSADAPVANCHENDAPAVVDLQVTIPYHVSLSPAGTVVRAKAAPAPWGFPKTAFVQSIAVT